MTTRVLDVYEIAYLAGGQDRMVDAALVALVQSGRVRVHRPGQLATVSLARRHPVEAAILDAVGPVGHRGMDTIRWRLAGDTRLVDVGRALHREGLLGRHLPHLPGGRPDVPTAAGRRALHRLMAEQSWDDVAPGTDAMTVALGGRARMTDPELCAIFEETRTVRPLTRASRSADPAEAAAEDLDAVRRTPGVLHGSRNEWFAPVGPTAPRVRSNRRGPR
jgi:hypothetical protein